MSEYQSADIAEVSLEFGTDLKVGRINMDPDRKRASANIILRVPSVDSKLIIRRVASDASLVLLIVTYVVASLLGYYREALIAIPLLMADFAISYYLKFFSEKTISKAYLNLFPKAKIIENGKRKKLDFSDVEVGDLIYFNRGDIIPADARLIFSENLYVTEKLFTGANGKVEGKTLKKDHEVIYNGDVSRSSYDNMVYAGSAVASGRGRAIVTAIGAETRVGNLDNGVMPVSENDRPAFLSDLEKFFKRFSLFILISLIPISFALIYWNTQNEITSEQNSILYIFLLMLALSVTSMSELISAPASFIISHTLFNDKGENYPGVTKLSSVDKIAEADTLLILCPEVLKDQKQLVRRVFFSDREYRFDSLKSDDLGNFAETLYPLYCSQPFLGDVREFAVVKRYVSERRLTDAASRNRSKRKYLRNFPLPGARACVFSADGNSPTEYVAQCADPGIIDECDCFRTDGGSTWKFDDHSRNRVIDTYNQYCELGLKASLFISKYNDDEMPVFEGILAVGEEYPFCDGSVFVDFADNKVRPILILDSESEENVKLAVNSGLVNEINEIFFASDFETTGVSLKDALADHKVFLGFDAKQTSELVKLLYDRGRTVLPIIKDWSHRKMIARTTVYATQSECSYDSVRIASSAVLRPPDALTHTGGIADALNCIKNSALSRLKLGAFKNYLLFATFARLFTVTISLLSGYSSLPITPLMILLIGLPSDIFALLVIANLKVSHVRAGKDAHAAKSKLFSASLCVLGSFLISLGSFIIAKILLERNLICSANLQTYNLYATVSVQIFALGAVLHSLRRATDGMRFNLAYFVSLFLWLAYLLLQHWIPESVYLAVSEFGLYRIDFIAVAFVVVSGLLSYVSVAAIKLLSKIMKL